MARPKTYPLLIGADKLPALANDSRADAEWRVLSLPAPSDKAEVAQWSAIVASARKGGPLTSVEALELDSGPTTLKRRQELDYRDMMFGREGAEYHGLF